jgi:UDP-N-acetylmuramoyl-tripeptide--D-alanyl-D-alanine ligase
MRIPHHDIINGINKINNSNLRHQILKTPLGFYILDDSYNSSYESLLASLELLYDQKGYSGKSVLLGDILELGDQSETIHAAVGKMVAKYRFDNLFLFGNQVSYIAESAIANGFPKTKIFVNSDIHSPEITSAYICQNMKPNEILLAKASHKMNLRRIINLITGNQNEK